jgi:hypothetical protein
MILICLRDPTKSMKDYMSTKYDAVVEFDKDFIFSIQGLLNKDQLQEIFIRNGYNVSFNVLHHNAICTWASRIKFNNPDEYLFLQLSLIDNNFIELS